MSAPPPPPPGPFYNVQHSPIGAFASLTAGFPGARGGLGLELGGPADEPLYIGCTAPDQADTFLAFPFFEADGADDEGARYVSDDAEEATMDDHGLGDRADLAFEALAADRFTRGLNLGTDTWTVPDAGLTLRILTPAPPLPDPEADDVNHDGLRLATCPAVPIELTLDNTDGTHPRQLFFGFQGSDPYSQLRAAASADGRVRGLAQGRIKGVFADAADLLVSRAFSPEAALRPKHPENAAFALGPVGMLSVTVPAGETRTLHLAACVYREGIVTTGEDAAYLYTRYFENLEAVAALALDHAEPFARLAEERDRRLDATGLTETQRWHVAHTVHSYYGSTELLDLVDHPEAALPCRRDHRTPCWVVNEGEYRMMNTFDLTVDMLFYELDHHPWTVRNTLDRFIDRYSFEDRVKFPNAGSDEHHPGGLSFTHDQGVANHFTPPGTSSYEVPNLSGCFSHMTCEQLVNFVCCAGTYLHTTADTAWRDRRRSTFERCLDSLINRDHPDPARRNGVMSLDSDRTGTGDEITTYDSLDESLGQARNNTYLAVKGWAAYLLLETTFRSLGDDERAETARAQAALAAATLAAAALPAGTLPSVIDEGHDAPIISTIEGLVFPFVAGRRDALAADGPYAELIAALRTHIEAALVPGVCVFDDDANAGAWQLSANTANSWLSKIYLNQFVYHAVLGYPRDTDAADLADRRHRQWLLHERQSYHAWSDQCYAGVPRGSLYYPRGVTSWLWVTGGETAALPPVS